MANTQEPMCDNPVLLANVANISCMPLFQAITQGYRVLDYVVDCLDLALNTSSIYCCKDRLRYGIVYEADIIKQKYPQHDFSSCAATNMNDSGATNNGSSDGTSMKSCRTSSGFFIQSLAQYCSLSVYQLQNNLDGTMACRMFSDTIQCFAIAANYQGYSCTVNDMLMVSRESTSLFGLQSFNYTSCEAVQPITLRNPGTSSPCNDDKVKEYLLTYACTQFSGQNLAMVTEDNFCSKARETNHCLQKWLAGYGMICSMKETALMMHGIPKTEYLGCVDGCGLTYYQGTCDDKVALMEEVDVCKQNITATIGKSEYEQCGKYWPDAVECIQDVLNDGGADCDRDNIALRLRTYSTPVLNAWGVYSADTCLKDKFCKTFFGGGISDSDSTARKALVPNVPNVVGCITFLELLTTVGSELPLATKCRLYVEGLRCMEVKGSIYGDTCTKEDFHKYLSKYATTVNVTAFPVDQCPDTIVVMAATQEPMCNNSVLLATLANIACMPSIQTMTPGCGILDDVVQCLHRTLNMSSIHCCKDSLRYGIVSEADIIKQKYSQHDFSSCETTDMSDSGVTNNGSSDRTDMESCRTSSGFFIQSIAQYCGLSIYQLQNNLDGTMACRMFSDTIQCLAIAANYQGYSCTVNDMLMASRESPSLFGLESFNSTSCEAVQPVTLRNPGTSSPCNDDKVKEYLLTYACTQFSGQNLAMVTEDNFCSKARETNHCLQKWLAGYGMICSMKETAQMMHGIPKTEYLGCFDGCGLTYYQGTCDERVALIEELSVCKQNITAIVGNLEYEECSNYWPDAVECIQGVLHNGGADCDGDNIALRLRDYSTPILNVWGVYSAETCLNGTVSQ